MTCPDALQKGCQANVVATINGLISLLALSELFSPKGVVLLGGHKSLYVALSKKNHDMVVVGGGAIHRSRIVICTTLLYGCLFGLELIDHINSSHCKLKVTCC